MMPASAPKGFFYYTPPDKTPIKVSKQRDVAKHAGKLTTKSMVNRIKVDKKWVKAENLPDFGPLLAVSSASTVHKKKWKKGDFVYMTKAAGGKKIVVTEERGDELKIHYIGEPSANDEWLTANGVLTQLYETASVSWHACVSISHVVDLQAATIVFARSLSPIRRLIQHQNRHQIQRLMVAHSMAVGSGSTMMAHGVGLTCP